MAIQLPQGFKIGGRDPIDSRFVLTKAQMRSTNDNTMPDSYFAVCSDDKQFYVYDKTATASAETGKFKVIGSDLIIRVETLEGDVLELKGDVETLNSQVAQLQLDLDAKQDIATLPEAIKSNLPSALAGKLGVGLEIKDDKLGLNLEDSILQAEIFN